MSNSSSRDERDRLEQELLKKLDVAQRAYQVASAEYQRIRIEYGTLNHPDGNYAVHQAARNERVAIQEYAAALRLLTEFLVDRQVPGSAADPKP